MIPVSQKHSYKSYYCLSEDTIHNLSKQKQIMILFTEKLGIDNSYVALAPHIICYITALFEFNLSVSSIVKVHLYGFRQGFRDETNSEVPESINSKILLTVRNLSRVRSKINTPEPRFCKSALLFQDVAKLVIDYMLRSTQSSSFIYQAVSLIVFSYRTGLRLKSCLNIRVKDILSYRKNDKISYLEIFIDHLKCQELHLKYKMVAGCIHTSHPLNAVYLLNQHLHERFKNDPDISSLEKIVAKEYPSGLGDEKIWRNKTRIKIILRSAFTIGGYPKMSFHALRRGFVTDFVTFALPSNPGSKILESLLSAVNWDSNTSNMDRYLAEPVGHLVKR